MVLDTFRFRYEMSFKVLPNAIHTLRCESGMSVLSFFTHIFPDSEHRLLFPRWKTNEKSLVILHNTGSAATRPVIKVAVAKRTGRFNAILPHSFHDL